MEQTSLTLLPILFWPPNFSKPPLSIGLWRVRSWNFGADHQADMLLDIERKNALFSKGWWTGIWKGVGGNGVPFFSPNICLMFFRTRRSCLRLSMRMAMEFWTKMKLAGWMLQSTTSFQDLVTKEKNYQVQKKEIFSELCNISKFIVLKYIWISCL